MKAALHCISPPPDSCVITPKTVPWRLWDVYRNFQNDRLRFYDDWHGLWLINFITVEPGGYKSKKIQVTFDRVSWLTSTVCSNFGSFLFWFLIQIFGRCLQATNKKNCRKLELFFIMPRVTRNTILSSKPKTSKVTKHCRR